MKGNASSVWCQMARVVLRKVYTSQVLTLDLTVSHFHLSAVPLKLKKGIDNTPLKDVTRKKASPLSSVTTG